MNANDETKMFNEEQNNDATRVFDGEGSENKINNAAPISKKAFMNSPWAARAAFGVGGAAVGFAAGYASTASAGTTNKSQLSEAATPDPEDKTTGDTADFKPEDENSLPNSQTETESGSQAQEDVMNHINEAHHVASRPVDIPAQDNHVSQIEDNGGAIFGNHTHNLAGGEIEVNVVDENGNSFEFHSSTIGDDIYLHDIAVNSEFNVSEMEGTIPGQDEILLETASGIKIAYVDDDMSFGEAFAAAREQVGAPGVFTWHGNTYGTYYAEEWNDMSAAERGDFVHAVNFPDEAMIDAPVYTEVPSEPEAMFDIHVESITSIMDSEGGITTDAHITVDGIDTHFIDIDGDGQMDFVHIDIDGDGEFTPDVDAIIPIDEPITVDDVVEAIYDQNMTPDFDGVPDFTIDDDLAMTDFDSDALADF